MSKAFWKIFIPIVILVFGTILAESVRRNFQPMQGLTYHKQISITPEIGSERFYIVLMEIFNDTSETQEEIILNLSAIENLSSLEIYAKHQVGQLIEVSFESLEAGVSAGLGRLRVREGVEIQIVSRSRDLLNSEINVSSNSHVGVLRSNGEVLGARPIFDYFKIAFYGLLYVVPIFLAFVVFKARKYSKKSVNDTAFSLVHMGDVNLATEMLEGDLMKFGASVYELSNLSVCYSLLMRLDEASSLIDAAVLLGDNSNHDNILLAKAIHAWKSDDPIVAKESFDQFSKSRVFVFFNPRARYQHSKLIKELEEYILARSGASKQVA